MFNFSSHLEMKIKNMLRSYLTLVRMIVIKKIKNKKLCKRVDKEKSYILLELVQQLSGSIQRFLKKLAVALSYNPAIQILGTYPKGSKSTYPSDN